MLEVADHPLEHLEELAGVEPGPELGAMLGRIDRSELNGYQLVVVLEAWERQLAHDHAEFYGVMSDLSYSPPGGPDSPPHRQDEPAEFASDEIRAVLRLTRRAADHQLDLAYRVTMRLPRVGEAMLGGRLDLGRARVLAEGTEHLDIDQARRVVDDLIDDAPHLTTGQLRARLRRLTIEVDPEDAKHRLDRGVSDRRVVSYENPDGTGNILGGNLPPDRVAAIMRNLNRLARRVGDHTRTMDQIRADIYVDLLAGTGDHTAGSDRATVDIKVDLTTLVGLAEKAGEIPGWGPVVSDIARQVVGEQQDGQWRYQVTDPDTGAILGDGTTSRRPTATQQRHIQAQHETCVFPGCRMPAIDCDIDHTQSRTDGGHTLTPNLAPLCRHDHRLKHEGRWQLAKTADRTYQWTSPHGHTYTETGRSP